MNRKLLTKRLRGIALTSLRLFRLFSVFAAGLALALLLVVPGFAKTTTETIELGGGKDKYEITRSNGNIVRIKQSHQDEHEKWESDMKFDNNGNKVSQKATTERKEKYVNLQSTSDSEWKYDEKGRLISQKFNNKYYEPDNSGWKLTKDRTDTLTYDYHNGKATRRESHRDELKGEETSHDSTTEEAYKPPTANEIYQKILDQKRAELLKEKFGQAPPAAPQAPEVPGAPAVPAEYATTTPRWLQGAYVALNLGVGLTSSSAFNPTFAENFSVRDLRVNSAGSMSFPGNIKPAVVGGVKIGRYGCCFSDAPIWSYFGWNLDLSYQRYSMSQQGGTFQRTIWVNGDVFSNGTGTADFRGDGSLFTLAFMVNARYGFLPTPENPFGALQPYIGVGPAMMVNRFDPKISLTSFNGNPVSGGLDFNGETSVNLGLAAEAGLRYYPVQHVFLDLSYRYLYGRPDFTFTNNNNTATMKFNNSINNSTIRFGVGYAF